MLLTLHAIITTAVSALWIPTLGLLELDLDLGGHHLVAALGRGHGVSQVQLQAVLLVTGGELGGDTQCGVPNVNLDKN